MEAVPQNPQGEKGNLNTDLLNLSQEKLLELKIWLPGQMNLHRESDPEYFKELSDRLKEVEKLLIPN